MFIKQTLPIALPSIMRTTYKISSSHLSTHTHIKQAAFVIPISIDNIYTHIYMYNYKTNPTYNTYQYIHV